MHRYRKGGALLFLFIVIIVVYLLYITTKWMEDGQTPVANGTYTYAIVLGAKVNRTTPSLSLQYRLEAAATYANTYPHVQLVLSGGQGPGEDCSEAEAMYNYLVNKGIDPNRLLMEDKSTSTFENLSYSKQLLPTDVDAITIISSDYHLHRAQMIAENLQLETDVVAAKTPSSVSAKLRFRERLALLKTKVFGK